MTAVYWPVHKLCYLEEKDIFLAATGTSIQSLSRSTGTLLSIWPRDDIEGEISDDDSSDEPPSKRVRLDASDQPSLGRQVSDVSEADIEIVAEGKERQKGERRRPKVPDTAAPNISHLVVTRNGKHAVAITAEDKAVRVFRVSTRGRLRQLSSRCMPKKSCALLLNTDESSILTADKFGDVYAIPFFITDGYQSKVDTPQPEKVFKPSASELTVHSKRNLESLRQQQNQKQHKPRKEGPDFEHKLLLGHVSLLTDLAVAHADIDGKQRSFILTSDRDEHIRVSRGVPQTHIIHTFCMGHTDFVSKLCVLPPISAQHSHLLVAGNGEPTLRLHDWYSGREIDRFDILDALRDDIEAVLPPERGFDRLAVSGLWIVQVIEDTRRTQTVLMTLEGLPLLFNFDIATNDQQQRLKHCQTIKLSGNILDVIQLGQQATIAVAIDNTHKLGSTIDFREDSDGLVNPIRLLQLHVAKSRYNTDAIVLELSESQANLEIESVPATTLADKRDGKDFSLKNKGVERQYSILGEFIYGLENLRKRGNKVADEEAEEGQDPVPELEEMPEGEGLRE